MNVDLLRGNRNLLFWGLHTLGWSTYGLAQYLGSVVYESMPGYVQVIVDRRGLRLPAFGAAALAVPPVVGEAARAPC